MYVVHVHFYGNSKQEAALAMGTGECEGSLKVSYTAVNCGIECT